MGSSSGETEGKVSGKTWAEESDGKTNGNTVEKNNERLKKDE